MPIISQNLLFKILEYSDCNSYSLENLIGIPELTIKLHTNDTCYISYDCLDLLWQKAVEVSNKPILGYELHHVINMWEFGLLGRLIKYAPTLKDSLKVVEEFSILINNDTKLILTTLKHNSLVRIEYAESFYMKHPIMAKQKSLLTIGMFLKGINDLSGKDIKLNKIVLPQSFHNLLDIQSKTHELTYHSTTDVLFFIDNEVLAHKNIEGSQNHYNLLIAMGTNLIQQNFTLEQKISQFYATEDLSNFPTIKDVAKHLDKSSRSIQRTLNEKNLSFQDIQIEAKMKRALNYLRKGKNIKETAHHIGYAESSSFSKAFKKHFKYSPIKVKQSNGLDNITD